MKALLIGLISFSALAGGMTAKDTVQNPESISFFYPHTEQDETIWYDTMDELCGLLGAGLEIFNNHENIIGGERLRVLTCERIGELGDPKTKPKDDPFRMGYSKKIQMGNKTVISDPTIKILGKVRDIDKNSDGIGICRRFGFLAGIITKTERSGLFSLSQPIIDVDGSISQMMDINDHQVSEVECFGDTNPTQIKTQLTKTQPEK